MLKRLLAALGSSDIATTFQGVDASPVLGKDFLGSETFGSTVRAIEEADVILMVGTFPRKECPLIEARLRKRFLEGNVRMATVYHNDSDYQQKHTYDVEHLGSDLSVVQSIAEGVHPFCQALAQSKNPLILYGAKILQDEEASAIVAMLRDIETHTQAFSGTSQDVLNCIQPSASQMGSSWLGFQGSQKQTPSDETSILFGLHVSGEALLEAVEVRQPSFVVVQGSHGDAALKVADVVLPGAAYTEKDSLFVNTEGRIQGTRRALTPPGESRADWSILAALSEVLGVSQGMHSLEEVREALQGSLLGSNSSWGEAPGSRGSSRLPEPEWLPRFALGQASGSKKMTSWVNDYYRTDVISKNSAVMAKCSQILNEPNVGVQNG
jgi:NADH dehydrogenase/NADH:ubiquinone oxidoreductase subunit G